MAGKGQGYFHRALGSRCVSGYGVYVEPVAVQHVCAHVPVADDESEGRRGGQALGLSDAQRDPAPALWGFPSREGDKGVKNQRFDSEDCGASGRLAREVTR